jgi:DNA-binding beta-propeller fold protein YncE
MVRAWPRALLVGLSSLLMLAAGCATKPAGKTTYTFFPPSPDEPRVQFLTSFSSDIDLGRSSSFFDYLTGKPAGPNPLVKPYGLALQNGMLYVCDTMAGAIEVFDLAKKSARYFMPRGEGRLQVPINVTLDGDGTRYVADAGREQVLVFGKDENFIAALGEKEEMKPTDVAVTADRLYVADVKGHCVRVYSKADRKPLFTIPRDSKGEEGKLFSPTNLALDKEGRLLVSDTGAFAVQVYDLEGKYLRRIGQQGVAPGLFARPKGIAVDREGRAYVVDASTQVVQVFDPEGKLLMFFGQPGATTQGELYLPAAVKIDYDNTHLFQKLVAPGHKLEFLVLVTSQFGYNKVSVYGFLQRKQP